MNVIFVLFMLIGGPYADSPMVTVQQEFTSAESCNAFAAKVVNVSNQAGLQNAAVKYWACGRK